VRFKPYCLSRRRTIVGLILGRWQAIFMVFVGRYSPNGLHRRRKANGDGLTLIFGEKLLVHAGVGRW